MTAINNALLATLFVAAMVIGAFLGARIGYRFALRLVVREMQRYYLPGSEWYSVPKSYVNQLRDYAAEKD